MRQEEKQAEGRSHGGLEWRGGAVADQRGREASACSSWRLRMATAGRESIDSRLLLGGTRMEVAEVGAGTASASWTRRRRDASSCAGGSFVAAVAGGPELAPRGAAHPAILLRWPLTGGCGGES